MFIDRALLLSDAQSLTVSGASTNYIDALAPGAAYKAPFFIVLIKTTLANCTSVDFQLRGDSASSFSTDTVIVASGAIVVATLVAGYFALKVRLPVDKRFRYIRGYAVIVGGGATMTGAWDMKIVEDVDVLLP